MAVVHQKVAQGLGLGQTHAGISDTGTERERRGKERERERREEGREKGEEGNQEGKKEMIEGGEKRGGGSHHSKKLPTFSIFFPIFIKHVGNHITIASVKIKPSTILLFSIPALFPFLYNPSPFPLYLLVSILPPLCFPLAVWPDWSPQ